MRQYDIGRAAFLDIETTGFSARTCPVYLIGCLIPQGETGLFVQWLAEAPEEEAAILEESAAHLAGYRLITFNGDTFDLPFLAQRAAQHALSADAWQGDSLDLYRCFRPLKTLLRLPDQKQKTLEAFLGLSREDALSGGELIPLWQRYITRPDPETARLFLLHNEEDVLALPRLLPLLSYTALLEGDCTASECTAREQTEDSLAVTLRLARSVPQPVLMERGDIRLFLREDLARLTLPLFHGELRHFFPDYREYYYLPKEDMAIHKSVAAYVEREFRQRATPQTAYARREGVRARSRRFFIRSSLPRDSDGLPWVQPDTARRIRLSGNPFSNRF